MLNTGFSGTVRVFTSTMPPPHSPGRSGEGVFWITTDSISEVGKRSRGTTRFSGSGLGSDEPLRSVDEYRSPRPRT